MDIPTTASPAGGFPVVLFLHGWVGIDGAPSFDFYLKGESSYQAMIDFYVDAGYVVLTPGFRGHGGADGIDFMAAWDNGSYVSPVFYAIDTLNLIDSLDSVAGQADMAELFDIDTEHVFLASHSQGGDVALIAAAVAGEGSRLRHGVAGTSIWAGTFQSRFVQLETYYPMQTTTEAFFAGDGSWNGTPVGDDGTVNKHFVFAYPSDWIGTTDRSTWTWQHETWSLPSVADAWNVKLEQMYSAVNESVEDIDGASYAIVQEDGVASIRHDERVEAAMAEIGAFHTPEYLTEPLSLHFSDRDFYSFPDWNHELCRRVNGAGGDCTAHAYPGTNHSLRVSEHRWFSPEGTGDGFAVALQRDQRRFEQTRKAR
ncbi:MAG: hypothetical protein QNJ05_10415 [Woeseiaceae bacterium]|nr:hypothetical protein [Woeseiaceae bacterium]